MKKAICLILCFTCFSLTTLAHSTDKINPSNEQYSDNINKFIKNYNNQYLKNNKHLQCFHFNFSIEYDPQWEILHRDNNEGELEHIRLDLINPYSLDIYDAYFGSITLSIHKLKPNQSIKNFLGMEGETVTIGNASFLTRESFTKVSSTSNFLIFKVKSYNYHDSNYFDIYYTQIPRTNILLSIYLHANEYNKACNNEKHLFRIINSIKMTK